MSMAAKTAASSDRHALLTESGSHSLSKPARWTTLQLICIASIAVVVSALATNMDRIVAAINNNNHSQLNYEFGHSARDHFALSPNVTEFNFGAYGNAPHEVMQYQWNIRQHIESCVTCWERRERTPALNSLLQRLAVYLGIEDWTDLVYIINASHGMNAILRSVTRVLYNERCRSNATTCKLLQFSTAYFMVRRTTEFINNDPLSPQDQVIQFNITKPMMSNTSVLLKALETFLDEQLHGNNITIYMASVSHIASVPSVVYDVKRITQLFRKYGIITAIDGAHALGAIRVNISELDVDLWLGNGHKWLYSTRGSAVLYVKKEYQDLIFPAVISSNYQGDFQQRFIRPGTLDDSIWMSMGGALDFRAKFGDDAIMDYLHSTCMDGARVLTEMWNTSLLVYNEENIGSMINPILPSTDEAKISVLQSRLQSQYNVILPNVQLFDGEWYLRISCQIYHELSDFEWFGRLVLQILQEA